jgi:hypothetical protein
VNSTLCRAFFCLTFRYLYFLITIHQQKATKISKTVFFLAPNDWKLSFLNYHTLYVYLLITSKIYYLTSNVKGYYPAVTPVSLNFSTGTLLTEWMLDFFLVECIFKKQKMKRPVFNYYTFLSISTLSFVILTTE